MHPQSNVVRGCQKPSITKVVAGSGAVMAGAKVMAPMWMAPGTSGEMPPLQLSGAADHWTTGPLTILGDCPGWGGSPTRWEGFLSGHLVVAAGGKGEFFSWPCMRWD